MGSINPTYKEGLEKYKGKIIGFDKQGFAVYIDNQIGLNALDTCECCGRIIHSQLTNANFCPICAILLDLTNEDFVKEYCCLDKYQSCVNELNNDIEYRRYMLGLVRGFKSGVQFALKNAVPTLENKIGFKLY